MIAKLHPHDRFESVVSRTSARLDAYLQTPERVARWSDRLRELNGGSDPDVEKATKLYIDHAWSSDRIEAFTLKFFASPTVRSEAAKMFAEILEVPTLDAKLREVSNQIAADPALQEAAVKLMSMLLQTPVPATEVQAQLTTALTNPAITNGLDKLIDVMFDDPKIATSVSVHFDKICAIRTFAGTSTI